MKYSQIHTKLKQFFSLLFLITLFILAFNNECYSVTYYVDFDGGNDSAAGTSTGTAWLNLPGTRNTANTAYLNTHSISAGDTIYIKAGTTHSSVDGGRVLINSTYYAQPTNESGRITIQVSDSWGSGNVVFNGTSITVPQYFGIIHINQRNYITIQGTATNKFVVQNSSRYGIVGYGTSGTHQTGLKFRYVQVNNNSVDNGFDLAWSDNFEYRNCTGNSNGVKGFGLGADDDLKCDSGKYYDCIASNNGILSQDGHGFGLYGCTNIEYWRCTSYSNVRDGFDFGTCSNTNYSSAYYINCTSYNNGEDGFGCNGVTTGHTMPEAWYINCVAYGNAYGFTVYDGVKAHIYHCVSDANGNGFQFFNEAGLETPQIEVKNTINTNNTNSCLEGYTSAQVTENFDYNFYEKGSTNGAYMVNNYEGNNYTWAQFNTWKLSRSVDTHSHTDVGDGWASKFVNRAGHDYHLQATSSLLNQGTYLSYPPYVLLDRDGVTRSNPPEIGAYEYRGGPLAPQGLIIFPP